MNYPADRTTTIALPDLVESYNFKADSTKPKPVEFREAGYAYKNEVLRELFDAWAQGDKMNMSQAASLFVEGFSYALLSKDGLETTESLVRERQGGV